MPKKDTITAETPLFSSAKPSQLEVQKTHKSVTVICACITRHGGQEILLSIRRAPGVAGLDGKWELPGGKIEFGETPELTIVREINEELGLRVMPKRLLPYLHTNVWEYEHAIQHVVLACYECETEDEISQAGADARWFHSSEIDFNSTLPGTREFVSLALHTTWFDEVFIQFDLAGPDISAAKRFTVVSQPTLYTKYALVKYWGRIGTFPASKVQQFDSSREMDDQIVQTAKRRLADGYQITVLKGPEHPSELVSRISELAKLADEYRSTPNRIC
jgi:8-oxo-dGTP diphosphatase